MANTKKVLEELGLSDKESRVYLSLLELGPSPVQKIANKAEVNRVTAYVNLEALSKLGLVSTVEKGKKTYFTAEPPEQLQALIGKKETELQRKKSELMDILPELKNLFDYAGERPVIRYYEGFDGIESIRDDFYRASKKGDTAYGITSLDYLFKAYPKYEQESTKRRIDKGIFMKTIYTRKDGPIEIANKPGMLREARYIPSDIYPVSCDVSIYAEKKVALLFLGSNKPSGLVIEDKSFVETFKSIFNLAWEAAEKYNK